MAETARPGTAAPVAPPTERRLSGGRHVHRAANVLLAIGLVLFLGGVIGLTLTARIYSIPTESMEPTFPVGSRIVVDATTAGGDGVRRGDIVVFDGTDWNERGQLLVKRVIGIGGDTVACCDAAGRLTVNGRSVSETYLPPGVQPAASPLFGLTAFRVVVPPGRLFLVGDDRPNSLDSRVHLTDPNNGTIADAAVRGRVVAMVYPLGKAGFLPSTDAFARAGLGAVASTDVLVPALFWLTVGALGLLAVSGVLYPVAALVRRRDRGAAEGMP